MSTKTALRISDRYNCGAAITHKLETLEGQELLITGINETRIEDRVVCLVSAKIVETGEEVTFFAGGQVVVPVLLQVAMDASEDPSILPMAARFDKPGRAWLIS